MVPLAPQSCGWSLALQAYRMAAYIYCLGCCNKAHLLPLLLLTALDELPVTVQVTIKVVQARQVLQHTQACQFGALALNKGVALQLCSKPGEVYKLVRWAKLVQKSDAICKADDAQNVLKL